MARPLKKLDKDIIIKLAERGWSTRQIAGMIGCDEKTLRHRFSAEIEDARQHGKGKMIDLLWQRAVTDKSDRVLCHLADRILGKIPTPIDMSSGGEPGFKVVIEDYKNK